MTKITETLTKIIVSLVTICSCLLLLIECVAMGIYSELNNWNWLFLSVIPTSICVVFSITGLINFIKKP